METKPSETSLERGKKALLMGLNTCLPAKIETYDAKKKTCSVTPMITDFYQTDGAKPIHLDWPPIPDVPVAFFRFGGWSQTAPLKEGDPVLLVFSQRSLDEWLFSDGKTPVSPAHLETHTESDAIVIAGLFPQGDNEGEANDTDLIISHVDGNQLILTPSGAVSIICELLEIGAKGASTALAKGNITNENIMAIAAKLDVLCGMFGIPPIGLLPSVSSGKAFTND